jgi:hypothetical protein
MAPRADDTWKYKIKCPKCQTSCGRSASDTVYFCDTVRALPDG